MELSVTRKADRKAMADQIIRLCINRGASAARTDRRTCRPHEIVIDIEAAEGLCLSIDLDGDSSFPNLFVLSWYIKSGSEARLSDTFNAYVNQFHRRKATDVCYDYNEVLKTLDTRLRRAADGRAFMSERDFRTHPTPAWP